ncbi:acyl-CoA dehydratase activase [Spirochaeta africana]|uniref:CoA-substrate-specific enzyme activase, putative n=1 Tax=Spirochaeta africana (strain ATCC 700263 / DSM 8902 / Z-7692) TaxID=889378 RepID=H9UFD2_SPIAZ|nr:acyl-CoA dehydratase activase [Spirochaeta africana]AFG36225.1 CoA-substrate-specific enzyme activase, putative [Spirochaeta africana DSM 8902]
MQQTISADRSIGINVGSSSVKIVQLEGDRIVYSASVPHDGEFAETAKRILGELTADGNGVRGSAALVTGTEGRFLFKLKNTVEPVCVEAALAGLRKENETGLQPDAVVSLGGEDLVVYTLDANGRIVTSFSGSKCASGTGEFFKQQLGRMDMGLDQVAEVSPDCKVMPLSARCSVFMKSDCTHRLNKGEATKQDIVVSMSDVMATKVADFLRRAKIYRGEVLLTGGVTRNPHMLSALREKMPEISFVVPDTASFFEAYGAARLAQESGSPMPELNDLLLPHRVKFDRYTSLKPQLDRVTYLESPRGSVKPGGEYILGVDGGSTTTKACLIDIEERTIVAEHYGRTHGDPVAALKECLREIDRQVRDEIGDAPIMISTAATTGSSREILGVFLETQAVYNEIIAHAVGTTHFDPEVDTIFEIGGQDAKYVYIKNQVPIDYAMNEACSAGTGSFLEESASGDLNIKHAREIGPVALEAEAPLKFGEHCSAFINSDIRNAIQQGAGKADITAGIVTSIVSNYLNRVVGNRSIGKKIVLQGGVAKNTAVAPAFALLLDKEILVPPNPELMGAYGVGLLALQKIEEGLLDKQVYRIEEILQTEIVYEREFTCKVCENYCPIRILNINGHKYKFGGRCNLYANSRKKKNFRDADVHNYVEKRMQLMFEEMAPPAAGPPAGAPPAAAPTAAEPTIPADAGSARVTTIGIPRSFSVYTMYPLYSWFFHELGMRTVLSDEIKSEGVARVESTYCFPAEIAHGAVQDILDKGADYIFLPHYRDMPSYESDVHANFCPITQGLPYYIKKAFPDLADDKLLQPVVSFKYGKKKALSYFVEMASRLGVSEAAATRAFETAYAKQDEYFRRAQEMGRVAIAEARAADRPVIALLGRPYNAFTKDANMGIPKKFTSRGFTIIPFDIMPFEGEDIFPNMYWYYGQQDMKAAQFLKNEENIYVTFITNFSCAPDSFMLHYLKWIMGTKPFLILELDSHSADAGVDTRVEAFLDIIEGYRRKIGDIRQERYDNGLRFVNTGDENIYVRDEHAAKDIPIRHNPRVKVLVSNMGDLAAKMVAEVINSTGIQAVALPPADQKTLQIARAHASGKECVPSHLVLGGALKFLASEEYRKDELYLLFVPITTGPCRTGQYFVFYENLFRDLRIENVVVFTMSADNSYTELGPKFSRHTWWAMVISDYMKDIETTLRACAVNPEQAMVEFHRHWSELIDIARTDVTRAPVLLRQISEELKQVPLKQRMIDAPRALIVGEIYVRRDDFAVDELIELFSRKGIIGKVSGTTEWIHYLDFVRRYDLRKRLKLVPWWRRWFSAPARGLLKLRLEVAWKHWVEKQVRNALAGCELVPPTPHNMDRIMQNTEQHFLSHELNSEIAISSGVAATAMQSGYSGVVNISPFACLIGRVIEGIYTPWARDRQYPIISVEVDGNLLPAGIKSKLDIFMLNVLRFRQNPDLSELVEDPDLDGLLPADETGPDRDTDPGADGSGRRDDRSLTERAEHEAQKQRIRELQQETVGAK